MTQEQLELEISTIEACYENNHHKETSRISIKKTDDWKLKNSSLEYFLNSLEPKDRTLLKRFVHLDTVCRNINMSPAFWRVQGYICLSDILDYLEEWYDEGERVDAFEELFKKIEFDHYFCDGYNKEEYKILSFNNLTYISILSLDVLHRIL